MGLGFWVKVHQGVEWMRGRGAVGRRVKGPKREVPGEGEAGQQLIQGGSRGDATVLAQWGAIYRGTGVAAAFGSVLRYDS